jgi:hypothetical protein
MTVNGSGYTTQPTVAFTGANQSAAPNAIAEITTSGSTNNQTVLNAAGTGAVVLNGSNNAGTGGVVFGSGGAAESTVATVDGHGNANFLGTLQVAGVTTHGGSVTVKNQADAEIDSTLWAGLTASQKESFIYKDWNGNSQWYMVKDAGNNWELNSAVDSIDHIKAYQNGETMLNSSGTGYVSVNREANSGSGGLVVFSGGTSPTAELTVTGSGNVTANGFLSGRFAMGVGTMTMAANAAAGSGASMACASGHVCDGVSGTVTLTTGSSPGTGTLGTLSFPNTHTNEANCVVSVQSGTGLVSSVGWNETTTAVTLTANAALSGSTAYSVRYWCGGN